MQLRKPTQWRVRSTFLGERAAAVYGLQAMLADARDGKRRPEIRSAALGIVRQCADVDAECYLRALWGWAAVTLRYVPDPVGEDYIQHPLYTLQTLAGDCDDLAPLFAALAGSVGLQSYLLVGSANPGATIPGHVLAAVEIGGLLVAADLSMEHRQLGATPVGFRVMRAERV